MLRAAANTMLCQASADVNTEGEMGELSHFVLRFTMEEAYPYDEVCARSARRGALMCARGGRKAWNQTHISRSTPRERSPLRAFERHEPFFPTTTSVLEGATDNPQ